MSLLNLCAHVATYTNLILLEIELFLTLLKALKLLSLVAFVAGITDISFTILTISEKYSLSVQVTTTSCRLLQSLDHNQMKNQHQHLYEECEVEILGVSYSSHFHKIQLLH